MDNSTDMALAAATISAELLETGPIFINLADQIALTAFAFLVLIVGLLMNGMFVGLVLCNYELRTPYFTILIANSIYGLVSSATVFLSIIYISLSGSNPYRANRTMCFVHRMFSMMPVLCLIHSIILLSVERLLFFYQPFWYLRMVTVRRVILVELMLLTFSSIFSGLTTAAGTIYFSPSMLLCSNLTKSWVWWSQMALYYVPNMTTIAMTIASLYRLVLRKRRINTRAVFSVSTESTSGCQSTLEASTTAISDNTGCSTSVETERQRSSTEVHVSAPSQIKAAMKLVGLISGVLWLTVFPGVTAMNIIVWKNLFVVAELGLNTKARMMLRFINYVQVVSWIAESVIYFLVNPTLKSRLCHLLGKQ